MYVLKKEIPDEIKSSFTSTDRFERGVPFLFFNIFHRALLHETIKGTLVINLTENASKFYKPESHGKGAT